MPQDYTACAPPPERRSGSSTGAASATRCAASTRSSRPSSAPRTPAGVCSVPRGIMGAMFYLFHGPDEFTMREELARLRSGGGFELSQDVYPGGEVSLATITATCDTLPFLSARRFVVVDGLPKRRRASKEQGAAPGDQSGDRGAGATAPGSAADGRSREGGAGLKGGAGSGADPTAFTQGMAEYVRRLPGTSALTSLAAQDLEASHPLLLAAQRFGQARAFQAPKGAQLETWLARRAGALHPPPAPNAAGLPATPGAAGP